MDQIRLRREEIAFYESEVRQIQSQLPDANLSYRKTEQEIKLSIKATSAEKCVNTLLQAQEEARVNMIKMRMEAFKATFARLHPIQSALVELVSALREELNLPRDDARFMEQHKEMERRAWRAVNKAFGIDPPGPMPEII